MTTSVLIVEDEPEFLQRFTEAVLADPELSLVAGVTTGRAGLAMLDAQPPDVMLVDLGLPDISGIELIRHAAKHLPSCDVLVVTMFADDAHVLGSIEAGATGYLLKDAQATRIASAIHEVRAGGSPISPSIARKVLAAFRVAPQAGVQTPAPAAAAPVVAAAPAEPSPLSERETEILRLVAKGFSFDAVGELLAISPHTVVTHVKKIYRKLAVHSRGEAVYEASQMGLL
ncbi:MAG: response regulator transcription factor [Rubrivivax sp.]|nr:response regulator transcription factor [Rubrivivax sp.]